MKYIELVPSATGAPRVLDNAESLSLLPQLPLLPMILMRFEFDKPVPPIVMLVAVLMIAVNA
jgi:hypothetical protein